MTLARHLCDNEGVWLFNPWMNILFVVHAICVFVAILKEYYRGYS